MFEMSGKKQADFQRERLEKQFEIEAEKKKHREFF